MNKPQGAQAATGGARAASAVAGVVSVLLAGCAAPLASVGELGGKTLELVGLKTPDLTADLPRRDQRVAIRLQASPSLNADAHGEPLSLVVRLYTLRKTDTFLGAAYGVFGQAEQEKQAFGEDLVGSRDVQLVPGKSLQWTERVPADASHLGVVALFHRPAPQRWRYSFEAAGLARSGLTLGVHSCAMSVHAGAPDNVDASFARSSPGVCQ